MSTGPGAKPYIFLAAGLLAGAALGYGLGLDAVGRLHAAPQPAKEIKAEPSREAEPARPGNRSAAKTADRYVQMGQFIVPVLRGGETQAFVLADVTLDMGTPERATEIADNQPRYRDAILQSLYVEAGNGAFETPDFNPARLGEHVGAALARNFPDVPVERVMFARLLLQDNKRR